MIGHPIVRKVIDSKKFVTGRPTVQVDSEENSDQEVHRIGHVNLLETYATSRQKI